MWSDQDRLFSSGNLLFANACSSRNPQAMVYFWSLGTKSKTRRLRSALRIVKARISNRPQSASDARVDDDGRSNRPTRTHRIFHSAIFHPITPYNVWFFWVSRHRSIILAKKMETFSGRFWEIPGNMRKIQWIIRNVGWSQKTPWFSSKQSLESHPEVFLTGEPNTNNKNSDKASVHRAFSLLKRKTRIFLAIFSFECQFRPYSSAIFHPNTPQIFFCPLSAHDKWWFEQKKSPHFREKYLVLRSAIISSTNQSPSTKSISCQLRTGIVKCGTSVCQAEFFC